MKVIRRVAKCLSPITGSPSIGATLKFLWVASVVVLPSILFILWVWMSLVFFFIGTEKNSNYDDDGGGTRNKYSFGLWLNLTLFVGIFGGNVVEWFRGATQKHAPPVLIGFLTGTVLSLSLMTFTLGTIILGYRRFQASMEISDGPRSLELFASVVFLSEFVTLALFGSCLVGSQAELLKEFSSGTTSSNIGDDHSVDSTISNESLATLGTIVTKDGLVEAMSSMGEFGSSSYIPPSFQGILRTLSGEERKESEDCSAENAGIRFQLSSTSVGDETVDITLHDDNNEKKNKDFRLPKVETL